MVDKNDALLREVDEELRREQMEKLWERYGIYVIAVALVIVAVVAGKQLWDWRQRALAEAGGRGYEAAVALIEAGKSDEADKALNEIIASGHKGYKSLAELHQAGRELKAGNTKNALAIFEALSTAGGVDATLRAFARIQAASLRLGEADFTEMQNRLNDLVDGTTPWRIPARELLGTAAFRAGKLSEARTMLTPLLIDPATPESTQKRVGVLLGSIAAAEVATGAEAKSAPKEEPAAGASAPVPAAAAPAATSDPASAGPK